jgi:hypothetical protein
MRHLLCVCLMGIASSIAAVSASADTPANPPTEACVAFFSNGGAQGDFIRDVASEGPGAVGTISSAFGTSGGNGPFVPHNCG